MATKEYKLKDLLVIKNGKDYKNLLDGPVPVYGTGGVMTYVNDKLYSGESILLPRKGSLENITYVNGDFWTVDTMYWSIVNETIAYPKYLYLYLSLLDLSKKDSGSTLPSMTFDSYYSVPVKLPSKEKQKEIANFIFQIIGKIEKNNEIIKELESMSKTLYDYWFLQFEFPNKEGKPYRTSGGKMVYNSTIKRDIPKSWQVVNLRNTKLCKLIKTGIDYFEGEKIYLATSDLEGTEIINDSEKIHFENRLSRANMQPIVNSVWFAKMKNTTKNLLLNEASKDIINNYILSTGLSGLSCNKNTLYYLWNYIAGEYFEKKKDLVASGATQQAINESDLSDFIIIEPNQDLLAKYTRLVAPIYLTINKNKQQNKHLAELRDFLLPLLMNGQVTVRA